MGAVAAVAAVVFTAGAQVYQGVQENKAAKAQTEQLRKQAAIAEQEAQRAATVKAEERRKFIAQQKVAFLNNGISLEGSAQAVFEDTNRMFQEEIDAIIRSGAADAAYLRDEANIKASSGRAALTTGVLKSIGTAVSGGSKISGKTTDPMSGYTFSSAGGSYGQNYGILK